MYNATATVTGSNNTIAFGTSGDDVSLYNTGGQLNLWDTINGSNGTINLNNANAAVHGSNDTVSLSNASAGIVGGNDTVNLSSASGNVNLWNTGSASDTVNGSNGTLYMYSAMAAFVGGNDIINFSSGSNVANVWNTGSAGDTLTDSNGANDSTSSVNLFNAVVTLGSAYAGTVDFYTSTGTLRLENSSSFAGTVAGLHGQDTIDFADIGFGANSTLGYAPNSNNSGGTLSLSDGTHTANIALLGSYMASSFVAASDGHGGTLVSEAAQASTQTPIVAQPHM